MSEGLFLTNSKVSIAFLISTILLSSSSLINFDHKEELLEQKDINQLTKLQSRALTEARNSAVDIGWERQIQASGSGYEYGEAIAVDSSGNAYVSGLFCNQMTLGSTTLVKIGICDMFLAKMAPSGYWYWAIQVGGADSRTKSTYHTISIANDGGVFLSGYSNASSLTFGSITIENSHSPSNSVFLAKSSSSGEWLWAKMVGGQNATYSKSVQSTPDGGVAVAGMFYSPSISFDSYSIYNTNTSQSDIFVAKADADGNWLWASSAGGTEWDNAQDLVISSDGMLNVIGDYNDQAQFGNHALSSTANDSVFISTISEINGTWMSAISLESNLYVTLTGIGVGLDNSVTITGNFAGSMDFGVETLESVNNDALDLFVAKLDSDSNWVWASSAGGSATDCAYDVVIGAHGRTIVVGHFTSPVITYQNSGSFMPSLSNSNQWDENWDLYVAWLDTDGNWEGVIGAYGNDMDKLKAVDISTNGMVYVTGRTNSTSLQIGLDERSTSGYEDMFVALLDLDSDGDEIGDGRDSFPNDSTQQSDSDNDGYGDNPWGYNGDRCPEDYTQWQDADGDGYCDNPNGFSPDMCPDDYYQWQDYDGDGYCDDGWGDNTDEFPYDSTQWKDSDGDGYGDNPSGNNGDDFPSDPTQFRDSDGDGFGDSQSGNNPDAFKNEPTQWLDSDNDGYGDNPNGVDGDRCLGTSSSERRYVDENGCGASQRDTDNDGVVDSLDACEDSTDISTANLEGCDAYQRDFDGDGLVDATDPCPDSVENLCLEATIGAGDKESSTEARLLWASLGLLILIAILLIIMLFRRGNKGNPTPIFIQTPQQWK